MSSSHLLLQLFPLLQFDRAFVLNSLPNVRFHNFPNPNVTVYSDTSCANMDFIEQANGTGRPTYKTYNQLEKAKDILHPYGVTMEVLLMLPLYSIFMSATLGYLRGFPRSRKAAAIGYPPRMVIVHLIACLAIVGRYYIRLMFVKPMIPDRLDLGLGALQLATAWYLAKWSPSKQVLYRSSFLVMPILMVVPLAMVYISGSPQWYRTAVKCVEWFLHFRLVAVASTKYHAFDSKRIPRDATFHLVSVPVTLALADWAAAIPIYFVSLPLVIFLIEWVTRQAQHK
jgi:hypothetical protein